MQEKRIYVKPTIKVVPVNIRSQILAGSGGTGADRDGYQFVPDGWDD